MTLAEIKRGDNFQITHIPDSTIRAQAIRLGLSEGAALSCREKIPGGPVIISRNLQEIAIGRGLAREILIEHLG